MGGFGSAIEALNNPSTGYLLTRERFSPTAFLSYMFIPLSSIAFPHIAIFCLTARKMSQFKRTVIFYPLCMVALWVPCVFLGVAANSVKESPQIEAKLQARAQLAAEGPRLQPQERDELRRKAGGDDVLLLLLERYAPLWLAGILGAGVMAAVMASDSQILALSTMFAEDFFAFYGGKLRFGERVQVQTGRIFVVVLTIVAYAIALRVPEGIFALAVQYAFSGYAALTPLLVAALFWRREHALGRAREHCLGGLGCRGGRGLSNSRPAFAKFALLVNRGSRGSRARASGGDCIRVPARSADDYNLGSLDGRSLFDDQGAEPRDSGALLSRRTARRVTVDGRGLLWPKRKRSRLGLTKIQWLICIVAALGFAFDTYELLMLPLILPPALQQLGGHTPGSPDFLYWRDLFFYVPSRVRRRFRIAWRLSDRQIRAAQGPGLQHLALCILRHGCGFCDFASDAAHFALHDFHRRLCRVCRCCRVARRTFPGS